MSQHQIVSVDRNVEANRELLLKRSEEGLSKYGVTTERQDLTLNQWMQHLIEELLDAANYAQAIKNQSPWLPIETAPKDGQRIDLFCAYGDNLTHREPDCFFSKDINYWFSMQNDFGEVVGNPTHWMPVPPKPQGI